MRQLRNFLRLSAANRWLVVEATLLTALARLAILAIPFRWIAPWLGRHAEVTNDATEVESPPILNRVGWAVQLVGRHTPWQSKCLVQAITARLMLGRRGLAGTIYLGLAKDPDGQMKAHAWLRSGDTIITGRVGMDRFTVLSSFAFGSPRVAQSNAA